MVEYLSNSYKKYINTLCAKGYINDESINNLLIVQFIIDLMFNDYKKCISEDEYKTFNNALNCLFNSNCLTPYYNYNQLMGKLLERHHNSTVICEHPSVEDDLQYIDFNVLLDTIKELKKEVKEIKDELNSIIIE